MIAFHTGVLNVLLFQYLGRLFHQVCIDPRGDFPVLFGDEFVATFGLGVGRGGLFELFGKGFIVEEGPGIVEFVVPRAFELLHAADYLGEFAVADEGEDGGIDAVAVRVVGVVIVARHAMERFGRFVGGCVLY